MPEQRDWFELCPSKRFDRLEPSRLTDRLEGLELLDTRDLFEPVLESNERLDPLLERRDLLESLLVMMDRLELPLWLLVFMPAPPPAPPKALSREGFERALKNPGRVEGTLLLLDDLLRVVSAVPTRRSPGPLPDDLLLVDSPVPCRLRPGITDLLVPDDLLLLLRVVSAVKARRRPGPAPISVSAGEVRRSRRETRASLEVMMEFVVSRVGLKPCLICYYVSELSMRRVF